MSDPVDDHLADMKAKRLVSLLYGLADDAAAAIQIGRPDVAERRLKLLLRRVEQTHPELALPQQQRQSTR